MNLFQTFFGVFFNFMVPNSTLRPMAYVQAIVKKSSLVAYFRDSGNPFFEIPGYLLRSVPLVVLDPTQFMIKNIAQNAYQINAIQAAFATSAMQLAAVKQRFFDELHLEMKEQGGVKKDYFLSYQKKKDRALDMSHNLIEDILHLHDKSIGPSPSKSTDPSHAKNGTQSDFNFL